MMVLVHLLLYGLTVTQDVEYERYVLRYVAKCFVKAFGIMGRIVKLLRRLDDGDDRGDETDNGSCFCSRHRDETSAEDEFRYCQRTRKQQHSLTVTRLKMGKDWRLQRFLNWSRPTDGTFLTPP
jgi:hypothetical protein